MNIFETAKKYYPRLWDKSRIEQLLKAGRLTQAEAAEIMDTYGEEYEEV